MNVRRAARAQQGIHNLAVPTLKQRFSTGEVHSFDTCRRTRNCGIEGIVAGIGIDNSVRTVPQG
jgi:hypothetical protein